MKFYIYLLLSTVAACSARCAEFDLLKHGTLFLAIPDGWRSQVDTVQTADPLGTNQVFTITHSNLTASCKISIGYVPHDPLDQAAVRKKLLRLAKDLESGSVEKKTTVQDFALKHGFGAYCVFTDASLVGKKPPQGEYRVMGIGQIEPEDNFLVIVSLLADDAKSPEFSTLVAIINSLRVEPSQSRTSGLNKS
jgi:hypothetical protein